MKILVVGSEEPGAIEEFYIKPILKQGVEVELFPAHSMFFKLYNKNLWNKFLLRLLPSGFYSRINRELMATVKRFGPDVVWIFKGMEIFPATIKEIQSRNVVTVNYNPDNPFIFSGRGSGNSNITKGLPFYDLQFTYNRETLRELHRLGYNASYLPFGYALSDSDFEEVKNEKEILKACFLGNPDKERAAVITTMATAGIPFDVYGSNWPRYVNHENIIVHPSVHGLDFWRVLRRYRLQLNVMRPHNEDSHNMRTFEIPGVGGIMLAPATPEHQLFFADKEEVYLYTSVADAIEKGKIIMDMDATKISEIRSKARYRSIHSKYHYDDLARNALVVIRNLIR